MMGRQWIVQLSVTSICLGLGLLLMAQLRTQSDIRRTADSADWEYAVAGLIEGNARLREEIEDLRRQLAELEETEGGAALLGSLVDQVNYLRIANGLVEVSGPGVAVEIRGSISVLDLHDLINELRNAGAEGMALNGRRIVAWTAVSTDGEHVTVDGWVLEPPYRLEAIGDGPTLEVALNRPGGLVSLLNQAREGIAITVRRQEKVTLPMNDQAMPLVYATRADEGTEP